MHSAVFPQSDFGDTAFCLQRRGNRWVCTRRVHGVMQVERLISTNPYDYLLPCWLPGKAFDNRGAAAFDRAQKAPRPPRWDIGNRKE